MDLQGKVAIVTGAGQGIGRVYAKRLAEDGAKVIIADINQENVKRVESELKEEGLQVLGVKVDVGSETETIQLAKTAKEHFGRIDILVNNAAIFSSIKMKAFTEITLDEWNQVMNVNVTGVFLCCKAVIPYMKEQKHGRIINISSGTVLNGRPYYLHYVTSKSGIIGFTRALAREVGDYDITVNTISPGPIMTEIDRGTVTPEQAKALVEQQCIKRQGKPDDLSGVVSFLSSDAAGYISGQWMNVDGGKSMH